MAGPLWSISVEEQFYLGWPLLLLLFGVNRIKQLALAMIAVALVTRILLAAYGAEHPAVCVTRLHGSTPLLSVQCSRFLFAAVLLE